MIEFGAFLKLLLYISLIACVCPTLEDSSLRYRPLVLRHRHRRLPRQARGCRVFPRTVRDRHGENAGSFAFRNFSVRPSCWALLGTLLLFVSKSF